MFKFTQEEEANEFIGFLVDNEYYCINVQKIQEIIYIPPISKIPNVPNFVEGVINLRGKIIRVINLRKWFKLPWKMYDNNSRILIVDLSDGTFGLLVDQILEVLRVEDEVKYELPTLLYRQPEISYVGNIITQEEELFVELHPDNFRT
jgi:purine-binding chemotaxis protein CheW